MKVTATDDTSHAAKVTLDGNSAEVLAGGHGSAGATMLADAAGATRVIIRAGTNNPSTGLTGLGVVHTVQAELIPNILIDGKTSRVTVGSREAPGSVMLPGATGNAAELTSQGLLALAGPTGKAGIIADGNRGTVSIGDDVATRVWLDGGAGYAGLGGAKKGGAIALFPITANGFDATDSTMFLDGSNGWLTVGGKTKSGGVQWFDDKSRQVAFLDAAKAMLSLGMHGAAGLISVLGADGKPSVTIRGSDGDIVLENGDCAEDFDVETALLEPGTVVVIGEGETMHASTAAYDRKVAGVVAGAGTCRPALRLGHRASTTPRKPVGLTGKVYCKVTAEDAAIEIGDLLTTSDVAGHAMKAADPLRAFGAVIGKALQPLAAGRGLIPILIALQ